MTNPSEKIAHYRPKCVADFKLATPGSINLDEYAANFQDEARIKDLQEEINTILKEGISAKNIQALSELTRKLSHEVNRAVFPFNYTHYGTTIFGSAQLSPDTIEFKEVSEIAKGLVLQGRIDINTGGGPGIMAAANLGAQMATKERKSKGKKCNARSNGLLIKLPFEQIPNSHLNTSSSHSTFGTRLNEFADKSNSIISWDGGLGTDLENSYIWQLKQVGHIESDLPLLMKRAAWEIIQETKMKVLYHARIAEDKIPLILQNDLTSVEFCDHPDDVVQAVLRHYEKWKKDVWDKLDGLSQEQLMEVRKAK